MYSLLTIEHNVDVSPEKSDSDILFIHGTQTSFNCTAGKMQGIDRLLRLKLKLQNSILFNK